MGKNESQGSVREWTMNADRPQLDKQPGMLANFVFPEELASRFGLQVGTLADWRSEGKGPGYFKAGRKIWYPKDQVEAWIERQIRGGAAMSLRNRGGVWHYHFKLDGKRLHQKAQLWPP